MNSSTQRIMAVLIALALMGSAPDDCSLLTATGAADFQSWSHVTVDGLRWQWCDAGPDGELGIGAPGAFDDIQRCYVCVVREGSEYRCWYTANGSGATGMGYAVGHA